MAAGTTRRAGRRAVRALAVVGAVAAALVVWVVAVPVAGVDLAARLGGEGPADDIGARAVAVTALGAGLAAWALLEVLERVTRRARRMWTGIALAVFVVSLVGPVSGGVGGAAKVALLVVHAAVAAVLVPALARTA